MGDGGCWRWGVEVLFAAEGLGFEGGGRALVWFGGADVELVFERFEAEEALGFDRLVEGEAGVVVQCAHLVQVACVDAQVDPVWR